MVPKNQNSKHKRSVFIDLWDGLVVVFLLIAVAIFFHAKGYFEVPVFDFFIFPNEGLDYLSLRFPTRVQDPPAYSMLLVFLSRFVSSKYPEVASGVLVNIGCFAFILFGLWRVARLHIGMRALFLVLLLIANPLSWYLALQPLNTMLCVAFLLGSALIWRGGPMWLLVLFALISSFIKQEAPLLFLAYGIVDFFDPKGKKRSLYVATASFLSIVSWEVATRIGNQGQNFYIGEILLFIHQLPNVKFIEQTFALSPFSFLPPSFAPVAAIAMFGHLIYSYHLARLKGNREMQAFLLFVLFYSVLHAVYTGDAPRYAYPILWIVYLVIVWSVGEWSNRRASWIRWVLYTAAVVVVAGNAFVIPTYLAKERYKGLENKLLAQWLETDNRRKPAYVITFSPTVAMYYTRGQDVEFFDVDQLYGTDPKCPSVSCLLLRDTKAKGRTIYVLSETSASPPSQFEIDYNRPLQTKIEAFVSSNRAQLRLIRRFSTTKKTVELHEFIGDVLGRE